MNYVVFNDTSYPALNINSWRLMIIEGNKSLQLSKGFHYMQVNDLHKIGQYIVDHELYFGREDFNGVIEIALMEPKRLHLIKGISIPQEDTVFIPCGNPLQ